MKYSIPLLVTLIVVGTVLPARAETPADPFPLQFAEIGTSGKSEFVNGSGRVIEDRRALSGFSAVRLNGPIDVELKASDHDSVTVKTEDNVVPLIETRVVGSDRPALEISVRPHASFHTSRTPVVIIEFRRLSELVIRGSGDVRADRIEADDFALSIAGSGDARIGDLQAKLFAAVLAGSGDLAVSGRADQQAFRIAGSGDVNAGHLEGRIVKVAIAGSGDVSVNASESLEVSIAGSGDLVYRGSPRIAQTIRGSGTVRRAR